MSRVSPVFSLLHDTKTSNEGGKNMYRQSTNFQRSEGNNRKTVLPDILRRTHNMVLRFPLGSRRYKVLAQEKDGPASVRNLTEREAPRRSENDELDHNRTVSTD